jgi:hypothetical protein
MTLKEAQVKWDEERTEIEEARDLFELQRDNARQEVNHLEAEVDRLKEENRSLWTLLNTATK